MQIICGLMLTALPSFLNSMKVKSTPTPQFNEPFSALGHGFEHVERIKVIVHFTSIMLITGRILNESLSH